MKIQEHNKEIKMLWTWRVALYNVNGEIQWPEWFVVTPLLLESVGLKDIVWEVDKTFIYVIKVSLTEQLGYMSAG